MTEPTVVIGGGIGGLVAAARLRQHGAEVTLIEARQTLGGLASAVVASGTTFDGGPYILLDRHRLGWALDQIGVDLSQLPMADLDPAYAVETATDRPLAIHCDLGRTAAELERRQPGSGDRYARFVRRATVGLDRLAPLLTEPHSVARFVSTGAWRASSWTLLSLGQLLRRHRLDGLPATAVQIWTLIAGADPRRAPGPMALVPALLHRDGAARPVGGIHRIVELIEERLRALGVDIVTAARVEAIETDGDRGVRSVRLDDGSVVPTRTVISDIGGSAALLDLVDVAPPPSIRWRLAGPLQSPGMTAYVRLRGPRPAEIRFRVDGEPAKARAVIHTDERDVDGWAPGRLIAPLGHDEARSLGADGQRALLDRYLAERWWRDGDDGEIEVEPVASRLVGDWGRTFGLRDDAMNLVMARRQMLAGRLPHRLRHIPGLYLTGSWTHPGQWISFCSVSGVLAADAAIDGRRV